MESPRALRRRLRQQEAEQKARFGEATYKPVIDTETDRICQRALGVGELQSYSHMYDPLSEDRKRHLAAAGMGGRARSFGLCCLVFCVVVLVTVVGLIHLHVIVVDL